MDRVAFTVPEFCEAFRISRAHLYNLIGRGEGPVFFKARKTDAHFPRGRGTMGAAHGDPCQRAIEPGRAAMSGLLWLPGEGS